MPEMKEFDDDDKPEYINDSRSNMTLDERIGETNGVQESALRSMKTTHQQFTVLRCKLILVGDAHVGKTALAQMFLTTGQNYPKSYLMTLGVEFAVKDIQLKNSNRKVELFLYDTGGQSVFNQRELGGQYWTNSSVAVYVYDVGSRKSFLSCSKWLAAVRSENSGRPVPGLLVANKTDLRDRGRVEVSHEEGSNFAKENGLTFFETSALRNTGVNELFEFVANAYSAKYDEAIARAENCV